jgi:hypothetical protein
MKTGTFIKVIEQEHSTMLSVTVKEGTTFPFPKKEESQAEYKVEAKKILDKLSKDFNPIGINSVMASMLYLLLEENYAGKNNMRKELQR